MVRTNAMLKKLVHEAKHTYEKHAKRRVHIFIADAFGSWRYSCARRSGMLYAAFLAGVDTSYTVSPEAARPP